VHYVNQLNYQIFDHTASDMQHPCIVFTSISVGLTTYQLINQSVNQNTG